MKKILFSLLIIVLLIGGFCYYRYYLKKENPKDNDNEQVNNEVIEKDIFNDYYDQAESLLNTLSIDEKIAQLLLVRRPINNDIAMQSKYQFGGIIFFGRDFENKTKEEVIKMISDLQNASKIPILTAIDEEGGIVSRISSNKNLVASPFKSPQELYKDNGYDAIYEDVINKSEILKELGLNLNLAPVVDVSTDKNDYMYKRTLGMDTDATSIYAETVINASKKGSVSYTLKHFPGYGSNKDTHVGESIDNKTLDDFKKYDLPPFEAGIKAGAEAVMVSHNIIAALDNENPSSISLNVHNLLTEDLKFTGVIITDDISMGALNNISDKEVKAIKAHNDLLITTDYEESFNNIKEALNNGALSIDDIDRSALKILAWKFYKKLI